MKKSIGIGFVGGGFITRFHIQSLIGVRDCEVLGVMSRTKSSAEESASLARAIGIGEAKVTVIGKRVEVRSDKLFYRPRHRINCTFPGPDGRWHWFGRQFLLN